jgi:hypothetical protein
MPPKKGSKRGSELGRAIIRRAAADSRTKRSAGCVGSAELLQQQQQQQQQ